jgi:hypothetical protein
MHVFVNLSLLWLHIAILLTFAGRDWSSAQPFRDGRALWLRHGTRLGFRDGGSVAGFRNETPDIELDLRKG